MRKPPHRQYEPRVVLERNKSGDTKWLCRRRNKPHDYIAAWRRRGWWTAYEVVERGIAELLEASEKFK